MMTTGDTKKEQTQDEQAVALSDDDLDDVVGAGPLVDATNTAGKVAGRMTSKVTSMASNAANKAGDTASAAAKEASDAGNALLDGFNQGLGGGDDDDGGETDNRSQT